jgi:tetratricopeptide (TPR) repeat protein
MNLPPSRLLTRLDADIAAERNPLRADLLRAERAAYLARQGQTEEAKTEIAALHQRYDGRPNFEMSAWVSLAESLVGFLSDMGPLGHDKMRRAYVLSKAGGLPKVQALSAAWMAHMEYSRLDVIAMAQYLREALKLAQPDHHGARSRASLVVAQALHLAGQMSLAAPWYKRARDHAVAEGDEATTSALMHNMSWLRMHMLRQTKMRGRDANAAGLHALIGVESTVGYDLLQGISALEVLKPILKAQILALEGSADQALELFDKHLSGQPGGMSRLECILIADRAWCLVQLGRIEEASVAANLAELRFLDETQVDDRAATHSRLAQVFGSLGDSEKGQMHQTLATKYWREFESLQEQITLELGGLTEAGA